MMGHRTNSTQRAILALGVVALLTFFLPIVHVAPSALGRVDWSAFDVTTAASFGASPVLRLYNTFNYWSSYAALAITLVLVWTPRWHMRVFAWSATNLWCVGKVDFDKITFYSLGTRWPAEGSFERLPAYYVLAIVIAAMLFLCWTDYKTKTV